MEGVNLPDECIGAQYWHYSIFRAPHRTEGMRNPIERAGPRSGSAELPVSVWMLRSNKGYAGHPR